MLDMTTTRTPPKPAQQLHLIPSRILLGLITTAVIIAGCGDSGTSPDTSPNTAAPPVIDLGNGADYKSTLDPAHVADVIDNPYMPLAVGSEWKYSGPGDQEGTTENITVVVTSDRKTVMGISAYVVHDTVEISGEVTEDTYDWFTQDDKGNVWYLGEQSTEYENGVAVSTAGSWEAGVDGALPGIAMPTQPASGDAFRQEYYAGEAEDTFQIIAVDRTLTVPFGTYDRVITTKDWTRLSPANIEEKWYAYGVGVIYETHIAGTGGPVELLSYTPGS